MKRLIFLLVVMSCTPSSFATLTGTITWEFNSVSDLDDFSTIGNVSVAGGEVLLDNYSGWPYEAYMLSNMQVAPGGDGAVTVSCTGSWYNDLGWDGFAGLGLSGQPGNWESSDSIKIYADDLNGFFINMKADDGLGQGLSIGSGALWGGEMEIMWSENRVTVWTENGGLIFDSTVPSLNGGISWDIPTVQMGALAFASFSPMVSALDVGFDSITLSWVPEPATIALLGLGGLLLSRNRKFNSSGQRSLPEHGKK